MNDAEKYLLRVLRGFVQGEDPGPFSGDWQQLYALSMMHSVTGILGHSVMSYPHEDNAPIAQMMRHQCLQTMALFSQRGEAMAKLTEALSNEGIDHLLFKGYVVRDYYTIPELRTFGDIDFLIRPDDRKKCDALMKQWGFEPKDDWEPIYSYLKGGEYYEIHTEVLETDISERADYREYFSHIWDYAIPKSEHTYVIKPEYHLLYLLTHIAKHIHGSGAGIRMYLDIAFFLKHFGDSLDWDWFSGELRKLNFYDFTNMVFTLVSREFGVKSPITLRDVAEQTNQDFLDFTMAGGTFGKFGRDSAVIQLKNQDIGEENVSKGKTLMHRIFPSASAIEARYVVLQNGAFSSHRFYPVRPLDMCRNEADYQQTVDEIARVMKVSLDLIAKKWSRTAVSVTGGRDSKGSLAAAAHLGDSVQYYSYNSQHAEKVDCDAAKRICDTVGVKHTTYDIPLDRALYPEYDLAKAILCVNSNRKYFNHNDIMKRIYFRRLHPFDVEVKSWTSEIGRAFYYKRYGVKRLQKKCTARRVNAMNNIYLLNPWLMYRTDAVYRRYLKDSEYNEHMFNYDWSDIIDLEMRDSRWGADVLSCEHMFSHDVTVPYNNRRLGDLFLRVPFEDRLADRTHIDFTHRLCPAVDAANISVKDVAHNNKRMWMDKIYYFVTSVRPF